MRGLALIGPALPRMRTDVPGRALAKQVALFAVPGLAERSLARRRSRLGAEAFVRATLELTCADPSAVSDGMRALAVALLEERANGPDAEQAHLEAARSLAGLVTRAAAYRATLTSISAPGIVLQGRHDRLVPVTGVAQLAELQPTWTLHLIDGVGHVPQIEAPRRTADLLLPWLTARSLDARTGPHRAGPDRPPGRCLVTAVPTCDRAAAVRPVLNLPNVLTLGRLLVVPFFAALLLLDGGSDGVRLLAAALFVLACLTDVVDGRIARSRGQVTDFGIMADPIADKALVGTALVGLSMLDVLPWWATLVVLGREVAVTAMRSALARYGMIPASRGGKLKCLTQNAAVTLYLLPLSGTAASLRAPVLLVAVVATVVTGVDYARQGARLHAGARRPERLPG